MKTMLVWVAAGVPVLAVLWGVSLIASPLIAAVAPLLVPLVSGIVSGGTGAIPVLPRKGPLAIFPFVLAAPLLFVSLSWGVVAWHINPVLVSVSGAQGLHYLPSGDPLTPGQVRGTLGDARIPVLISVEVKPNLAYATEIVAQLPTVKGANAKNGGTAGIWEITRTPNEVKLLLRRKPLSATEVGLGLALLQSKAGSP